MAVLAFSDAMAASAAVLAEAAWYGSLRGDVMLDKGMDAKFYGGCSRWCIKGSNEVVEELSAVCRFEHKFGTEDAGQAGVIRDIGHWYGGPDASGRVGKVLSYLAFETKNSGFLSFYHFQSIRYDTYHRPIKWISCP